MESQKIDFYTGEHRKHGGQVMDSGGGRGCAGRKAAVTLEMMPLIQRLYAQGFGYRKISKAVREEFEIRISFGTVRNFLKGQSCYGAGASSSNDPNWPVDPALYK